MFWTKKVTELEEEKNMLKNVITGLEGEKKSLKEQVADLQLKKKIEEEDIKHMIKIDRERKDIELEKERVKLQGAQFKAIGSIKDQYRDKTEEQLEKQLDMMKGMYGEILERLPNYNIKHNVKESR